MSSQQLRIALQIAEAKEAGTPLQWEFNKIGVWSNPQEDDVARYLGNGWEIRIKPLTLGREINGHKLPDGAEWHRSDWTQNMLPPPYRPLMLGELYSDCPEDEYDFGIGWKRPNHESFVNPPDCGFARTTRPIPSPSILTEEQKAQGWVDLGPEDVPPGSVFRPIDNCDWITVHSVDASGVWVDHNIHTPWSVLKNCSWKINRSIPLTGKWDKDAWEPCRKEKA